MKSVSRWSKVKSLDEEKWVLKAIGKSIKFRIPERKEPLRGVIKDRVAFKTRSISEITDFWDVIDLIDFDVNGKVKQAIRFGYYRRGKDGKLRWGSQTTLTEEINELKKLFKKAVKEKPWFKQLLEEVIG